MSIGMKPCYVTLQYSIRGMIAHQRLLADAHAGDDKKGLIRHGR